MRSLMAHEERIDKSDEEVEEKAFQVYGHNSNEWKYNGGCGGRGRGYGRGGENGSRDQFEGQSSSMSSVQCYYYCKRYGHKKERCWDKQRDEKEQSNFAQKVEEEEEDTLF